MIATSDKIFMGCGSSDMGNFNDWWEYDIASNSWTQNIYQVIQDIILFTLVLMMRSM